MYTKSVFSFTERLFAVFITLPVCVCVCKGGRVGVGLEVGGRFFFARHAFFSVTVAQNGQTTHSVYVQCIGGEEGGGEIGGQCADNGLQILIQNARKFY